MDLNIPFLDPKSHTEAWKGVQANAGGFRSEAMSPPSIKALSLSNTFLIIW